MAHELKFTVIIGRHPKTCIFFVTAALFRNRSATYPPAMASRTASIIALVAIDSLESEVITAFIREPDTF